MEKVKLIFTADIHLGITSSMAWDAEAIKMKKEKADIFVIGGDMSSSVINFSDTFDIFSDVAKNKFFIIGNHDVWVSEFGYSGESLEKYQALIETTKNGFSCLDKSPSVITADDGTTIGLVGNIGWYDYSFRDKKIDIMYPLAMNMYKLKKFPNGKVMWMDGKYVKWGSTDEHMTDYFAELLDTHISDIQPVDIICCFIHHIPFGKMVKKGNNEWNMGNAFSGSKKIEKAIRKYDNIKFVFCGHSHTKFEGELYGKKCFNVGVDYRKPGYMVIEI